MQSMIRRKSSANSESGATLIEVLIAGIVLIIGFMGTMLLIATAIATNSRNRMDSSATMLAAMVVEQVNAELGADTPSTTVLYDCSGANGGLGTQWTIDAGVGGADLATDGTGGIDFNQDQSTIVGNYFMNFVVGGGGASAICAPQTPVTYDVRWRLDTYGSTYLVTVGVKPAQALAPGSSGPATAGGKYYGLPIVLRTYLAPHQSFNE